jgi:deoxyadenosine/deoxycytidine kinase
MSVGVPTVGGRCPYIAVDGCIGSGKTTLVARLARRLGCEPLYEDLRDRLSVKFLDGLYRGDVKWGIDLELTIISLRFNQLNNLPIRQILVERPVVSDFCFAKGIIFATVNLRAREFELYKKVLRFYRRRLLAPDVVIFLDGQLEVIMGRIMRRGYDYEKQISEAYIAGLLRAYKQHYRSRPGCVKVSITEVDEALNPDWDVIVVDRLRREIARIV